MSYFKKKKSEKIKIKADINLNINLNIICKHIPNRSYVQSVNFIMKGFAMTGNVVLNALTDPTVTSRPVIIHFDDGLSPDVTVDMINPAATFDVPASEFTKTVTATPSGDVNPVGTGPSGPPFPFTIPTGGVLPPPSVVQAVNFTP